MRFIVDVSTQKILESNAQFSGTEVLFFANSSILLDKNYRNSGLKKAQAVADNLSRVLDLLKLTPIGYHEEIQAHEECKEDEAERLIEIAERYSRAEPSWPRQLMPGDRDLGYTTTVQPLAKLASEIEVIDPYVATKMLLNARELWLINRLIEDCPGTVKVLTQEEKGTRDLPFQTQREIYEMEFYNLIDKSNETKSKRFEMRINRFNRDFHNRSIRFLFDNGVASDHELAHGVDAFNSQIKDSDLARMTTEAYSARRSRNLNCPIRVVLKHDFS